MNMVMLKILTLQDVFHVLERHKIISDKWQNKKKGKDIKATSGLGHNQVVYMLIFLFYALCL